MAIVAMIADLTSLSPLRSILFVPGIRQELMPKAAKAGADALALDLEDSVPPASKDQARAIVAEELRAHPGRLTFIRINRPDFGHLEKDLSVLAPHPSQAIMVPKVEQPAGLLELDQRLTLFERVAGLSSGTIRVMVVIESALGLRNLFDCLRAAPRVRGAALANAEEGDFIVDIGGIWTPTGEALSYARGKFVCDARAAKAEWVFDGVFMNLSDDDALKREANIARIHGFDGKVAIHPRQVPAINTAFSPTAREIARAQALLKAFQAAEAKGLGAIKFEGMMIDYANVRRAERVIALAAAIGAEKASSPLFDGRES
jgi:citrate lyase subunit beta/citryl-CoA lyase